MTTLFISHGAPTLAMEPGETGRMLSELGTSLPRPTSILVISAHWDTKAAQVSFAEKPETIHDFGGFPPEMYKMQYPANGAPGLAKQVINVLEQANIPITTSSDRGLDHGAWVPLMLLYPQADIPVTQLSIQSHLGPAEHYQLGQAISPLQDDGVMILCSGAVTHNLSDFFSMNREALSLDYVPQFANWIANKIEHNDTDALLDYRKIAPGGVRAHPHEDHLSPLFVALGAAKDRENVRRYAPETTFGILAMDTYVWD